MNEEQEGFYNESGIQFINIFLNKTIFYKVKIV